MCVCVSVRARASLPFSPMTALSFNDLYLLNQIMLKVTAIMTPKHILRSPIV